MNIALNKNDEIVMKLLHYFITEQGYNPVVLQGAKDEIWLENNEGSYKIVRIVTNYIHNDEQLDFPVIYASAKEGIAKYNLNDESNDIKTVLQPSIDQKIEVLTEDQLFLKGKEDIEISNKVINTYNYYFSKSNKSVSYLPNS